MVGPCEIRGEFSGDIVAIAPIDSAKEGDISFLANGKYCKFVEKSHASAIILPPTYLGHPPSGSVYLVVDDPSLAINALCEEIGMELGETANPSIDPTSSIAATASIHPTSSVGPFCAIGHGVTVGERCSIGSHCSIGRNCAIGNDVILHPHVTLYGHCTIGNGCIIHSGAVIGCDGYGYASGPEGHKKLAHVGRVRLGDCVEIGANCAIDRARFAETTIGDGSKLDNLIQIGHNVSVGRNCLLVAQCGIAGSTKVGDGVVIAGQAGLAGHIDIGSGTMVAAQCGVPSDLPAKSTVRGTPAMNIGEANRFYVLRKRMPELFRRVDRLEKRLGEESS